MSNLTEDKMSIEEAEYILTEAVIEHPSINSYTYISAEEINIAINKILEEKLKNENKIKELENQIKEEKNKLERIIEEYKIDKIKYPMYTLKNKNVNPFALLNSSDCFETFMKNYGPTAREAGNTR